MLIELSDAGKKFNREWIFRTINYRFESGKKYALTGPNGSGKSTLLQVLAGSMTLSQGDIKWVMNQQNLDPDHVFKHLSIAAPYLELIEEMTAVEFLDFHRSFKPLLNNISITDILETIGLEKAAHKQIRYFSSGMKQRIKLAQAIFSDCSLLLLDEPCTNLDEHGYALYHHLIDTYAKEKTIIVSSNDVNEYGFCTNKIYVPDHK
ncbi:heme ABC exporter ATP-binding protein CcmA [Sediminibacterium sp. KACHI17]|uniref:Heme ABC exporter ATP-binding protein CcmA n=1 Tax=Sediminibacterium sp. KACHI17 TaxID=1751071 RepID=A0AAT9GIP3_9BACT